MVSFVISLIGRSNVGKSMLFNCLTRTRDALVSDIPGVTRDRRYGDVYWGGYKFTLIDTGGISESRNLEVEEGINDYINRQSYIAAREADLVLFVVDAYAGATDFDYKIIKYLFKLNKQIVITVNKIDDIELDFAMEYFYSFGIKEIIPVSAFSGYGIKNLLKRIIFLLFGDLNVRNRKILNRNINYFNDLKPKSLCCPIKLAVVGRPNVGKSTFINCVLNEERMVVYNIPGTTRDDIHIPLFYNGCNYIIIDTPGVLKRNMVFTKKMGDFFVNTFKIIKKADIVLLILDANDGVIDQDLTLLGYILNEGKSLVISVNKWDQLSINMRCKIKNVINDRIRFVFFVPLHFISALQKFGINDTMKSISISYQCSIKRISARCLTRIMNSAVNLHSPPLVKGRRIHLKYAHMGGNNPFIIVIHGSKVRSLSCSSYERYLINYFINSLCIVGTVVKIQFNEA